MERNSPQSRRAELMFDLEKDGILLTEEDQKEKE